MRISKGIKVFGDRHEMPRANVSDHAGKAQLYLVQTATDRFKIGTSTQTPPEKRFEDIYAFIPDMKVLGMWPIRKNWESHIREWATQGNPHLQSLSHKEKLSEVFEIKGGEIEEVLRTVQADIAEWIDMHSKKFPVEEGGSDEPQNVIEFSG